jgi:hypothetical protein
MAKPSTLLQLISGTLSLTVISHARKTVPQAEAILHVEELLQRQVRNCTIPKLNAANKHMLGLTTTCAKN